MLFKGGGQSKKTYIFFVNTNKNLAPTLATHQSFSLWSAGFSYEIRLQRSPKFEHRCRHFEQYSAARLRFRDVNPSKRFFSKWPRMSLLTTTLGYGCSWAISFWAKHAPNSEMVAFTDSEVDNRLGRNGFCWPCEGCQVSCRFLSFPPISSRTEWGYINTASEVASFETKFFRMAGTSEAET